MTLPVEPPIEPMLSAIQDELPAGDEWRYEPKWDGFRCLVFREGDRLQLQSRKTQPLERYFPELLPALKAALPERVVVDGEIVVAGPRGLDFDSLQLRIHPAASRVNKLSKEIPASFVAFDLLAAGDEDLRGQSYDERRARLAEALKQDHQIFLTPQTRSLEEAKRWFIEYEGAGMDGIIAKTAGQTYEPGERVMVKVKHHRTVDCVVGGYREHKNGGIGSLLLGLYDDKGVLHHVGHTTSMSAAEKKKLLERLKPLEEGGNSFGQGRTPGTPSRWSSGKELSWIQLRPELVCEVTFDYMQGDRFRHAAGFLRWRVDKAPRQCTFDQLSKPEQFSLEQVIRQRQAGAVRSE
ncbi:MAG TPA: ATP-dependent DNA ligase [Myxococcaceae bacterium]|nr:ATP-dependent DNA ligase [Myxococcaceae bacterium]